MLLMKIAVRGIIVKVVEGHFLGRHLVGGHVKDAKLKFKIEMPTINPTNDIAELRKGIEFIRKDVKEIHRFMNTLYDFKRQ